MSLALWFFKNGCKFSDFLPLETGPTSVPLEREQSESEETLCDSQGQVIEAHVASSWPDTTLEV